MVHHLFSCSDCSTFGHPVSLPCPHLCMLVCVRARVCDAVFVLYFAPGPSYISHPYRRISHLSEQPRFLYWKMELEPNTWITSLPFFFKLMNQGPHTSEMIAFFSPVSSL